MSTAIDLAIGRTRRTQRARARYERTPEAGDQGNAMAKNTICIWYDTEAEAAARFYAQTFPDSAVRRVVQAPGD